jgi:hypothetical protein
LSSQNFNGQHGRAFLFETVVNVRLGPQVDREMLTGLHTVRDIHCGKCDATLGWKYVSFASSPIKVAQSGVVDWSRICDDRSEHLSQPKSTRRASTF